ncbi:tyrosine-type recombinase/integrase [Virgibacillus doumboii]|uniref:tyrosine-type recombinase/integrase n=1 Tax=Virgibacillus doumboii TaxID=2697503 RepID=UPI0013E08CED|nr:tyrosine-type recombinase/integrase [Virgibacillus doumboii]
MKHFKEEIDVYHLQSRYSENYKMIIKRRLDEFLNYLADVTCTSIEDVHLEKIYETVSISGESLYFSSLDTKLLDQYFVEHLHKSYSWLHSSRRALQNFFLYLYRKYDFPILTDQMSVNIDEHKQKPRRKDKYVPTRHDLLKFLQSLLHNSSNLERDVLFFLLLISTGSRPSEIINTKVEDIDVLGETIYRKKTKNKSSKFIVLRDGYGAIIQRYINKCDLKKDDFLINHRGSQMSIQELQDLFASFLEKANLPIFTLHKLRHSFATIMAESGAEIMVIQQLLGHKKIHSTSTYINPNYIRNNGMELQVNKEIYKHIRKMN